MMILATPASFDPPPNPASCLEVYAYMYAFKQDICRAQMLYLHVGGHVLTMNPNDALEDTEPCKS